jgi:hypothetical protein
MAKFHLIITNNETGEIMCEHDSDAIIAGINTGDRVSSICQTACDDNTLAATCFAARMAIDDGLEDEPTVQRLYEKYVKKYAKKASKH